MQESDGALDLAGAQAARADVDVLRLAVYNRAYTLDIRLPLALRLQMRMADIHAGHFTFCTDFANTCHGYTSFAAQKTLRHKQQRYFITKCEEAQAVLSSCDTPGYSRRRFVPLGGRSHRHGG